MTQSMIVRIRARSGRDPMDMFMTAMRECERVCEYNGLTLLEVDFVAELPDKGMVSEAITQGGSSSIYVYRGEATPRSLPGLRAR